MWVARRPEVSCCAGGIFPRWVELLLVGNKGMARNADEVVSWNASPSKDAPGDVAQGKMCLKITSVLMNGGARNVLKVMAGGLFQNC
ncbi:hypothetical protein TNCV_1289011 [Trichonephila clavipes]|nr:hypothetical protein TNCV_1289011 [Trichonephila clavipes]